MKAKDNTLSIYRTLTPMGPITLHGFITEHTLSTGKAFKMWAWGDMMKNVTAQLEYFKK